MRIGPLGDFAGVSLEECAIRMAKTGADIIGEHNILIMFVIFVCMFQQKFNYKIVIDCFCSNTFVLTLGH